MQPAVQQRLLEVQNGQAEAIIRASCQQDLISAECCPCGASLDSWLHAAACLHVKPDHGAAQAQTSCASWPAAWGLSCFLQQSGSCALAH